MIHIAYLTPEYPHPKTGSAGGLGSSIKNLVQALSLLENVQVSVFIYGQPLNTIFREGKVTYHCIKHVNYKFGGFYLYRKHINSYLNNAIKKQHIDIIEAPDWTGITAFMRFKIPLIIRFHGSDTYFCHLEQRLQKWKNAFFEKQAIKYAKAFIAPTRFAGATSAKLFQIPVEKISTIHYGLQLELFNNKHPEKYKQYSLLNIGTLIRKKGVFQLAAIFNKLVIKEPRATLTLIGGDAPDITTGNSSTWLLMQSQLSTQALKNTTYKGKIPYDKVQEAIKNAHVCVFPSLAETLGMVTIESMALGKAVVNTSIGWAQDLIKHEVDGFMHHPDDAQAYIETITKLFNDKSLTTKIGLQAIESVSAKFDIHKIAHLNVAFYKNHLN